MNLEHPETERFETELRRLITIAFEPPLLAPTSALLTRRWAPSNRSRRAVVEALSAYRDAQEAIAARLISIETTVGALSGELRTARQKRDRAAERALTDKIDTLRRRQLILRRIVDAVVYIACEGYVWFIRRLSLQDNPRPIAPRTLAPLITQATRLNERDPCTLYLICDLTTTAQIGDLIEVSFDAQLRKRVRLVELKEGKVNRILMEKLGAVTGPENTLSIGETMGTKAAQQADRMLRQKARMQAVADIARKRQGIDPRTGAMLSRSKGGPDQPGYLADLRFLIEKAAANGQHLIKVDGCLTLAAARVDSSGEPSHVSAIHSLFHFKDHSRPCLLPKDPAAEIEALRKEPPVVDLVEQNLLANWSSPLFAWGNLDRVCDLLTGRIRVYAQLDTVAFMKLAAEHGVKMQWVTGRRADWLKKTGGTATIPGSPHASAIRVELPDGTRCELLSGGLARIFLELARPEGLIRMLLASSEDVRSIQKQVASGDGRVRGALAGENRCLT